MAVVSVLMPRRLRVSKDSWPVTPMAGPSWPASIRPLVTGKVVAVPITPQ